MKEMKFLEYSMNSTVSISEEIEKLDDDILTNLTEDIGKELDELLTKKDKYLDVKEEKEEVTDDILDFIDSTLYRDGDEE